MFNRRIFYRSVSFFFFFERKKPYGLKESLEIRPPCNVVAFVNTRKFRNNSCVQNRVLSCNCSWFNLSPPRKAHFKRQHFRVGRDTQNEHKSSYGN